ncbi:MAG TPA: Dna2/Cas4 domain-containing protein [Proteobacteria bacterium]|nr:Dna2/Cas4 domain-containing protein [Pseudomonadota bacterium]
MCPSGAGLFPLGGCVMIAALVIALAIFFAWLCLSGKKSLCNLGIPVRARAVSSDGSLFRKQRVIRSYEYRISGKPDDMLKENGYLIPVERKQRHRFYRSDAIQLGVYCFLMEKRYGQRPPYGYVILGNDERVKVKYDEKLKADVLWTIVEMRLILARIARLKKAAGVRPAQVKKSSEFRGSYEFPDADELLDPEEIKPAGLR